MTVELSDTRCLSRNRTATTYSFKASYGPSPVIKVFSASSHKPWEVGSLSFSCFREKGESRSERLTCACRMEGCAGTGTVLRNPASVCMRGTAGRALPTPCEGSRRPSSGKCLCTGTRRDPRDLHEHAQAGRKPRAQAGRKSRAQAGRKRHAQAGRKSREEAAALRPPATRPLAGRPAPLRRGRGLPPGGAG